MPRSNSHEENERLKQRDDVSAKYMMRAPVYCASDGRQGQGCALFSTWQHDGYLLLLRVETGAVLRVGRVVDQFLVLDDVDEVEVVLGVIW